MERRVRTLGLDELSQTVEGFALDNAASNRQGVAGAETVFEMLRAKNKVKIAITNSFHNKQFGLFFQPLTS